MTDSKTLKLHLDQNLYERLDKLAKVTRRDRAVLARQAIREFVKLNEWQIKEIKRGLREADAGNFATNREVEEMFKKWGARAR